jgi:predicted esterase
VLGTLDAETREVWLACHGYGQLAERFARGLAPLLGPGRAVVAPEGLHRFYLDPHDRPAAERRVGATWMTREDRETDIADTNAYLDAVAAAIHVPSPRARIATLGFSQGCATVARWAAASGIPLARIVLWGSGLPHDLDWERAVPRFRTIPLTFVIGEQDGYLTPERIAEQEQALRARDVEYEVLRYPGGHHLDAPTLRAIAVATTA